VALLRALAPALASIHAQNQTILAFDEAARLGLLDTYAGHDLSDLAQKHIAWAEVRERLAQFDRDEQDRLRMADLWSFQKKEIEAAKLHPGEDQKLETEKRVLANSEKLFGAATAAYQVLYEDDSSALTNISAARKQLEELARFDEKFLEALASLESAKAAIEDVSATARDYADQPTGDSLFNCLSITNVPNGSNDAINAFTTFPNFHCCRIQAWIKKIMYKTKRTPCVHPTYFTISGLPATYLRGMAINSRTR